MGLSKSALSGKGVSNNPLHQQSLQNVVTYLHGKNYRHVELRLLVPYYQDTRTVTSESIKAFNKFNDSMDERAEEIVVSTCKLLVNKIPPTMSFSSYSTQIQKVYKDDWVGSVQKMFNSIKDHIKHSQDESIHVIYLIDPSDFEKIQFQDHIPFVNYIVY